MRFSAPIRLDSLFRRLAICLLKNRFLPRGFTCNTRKNEEEKLVKNVSNNEQHIPTKERSEAGAQVSLFLNCASTGKPEIGPPSQLQHKRRCESGSVKRERKASQQPYLGMFHVEAGRKVNPSRPASLLLSVGESNCETSNGRAFF